MDGYLLASAFGALSSAEIRSLRDGQSSHLRSACERSICSYRCRIHALGVAVGYPQRVPFWCHFGGSKRPFGSAVLLHFQHQDITESPIKWALLAIFRGFLATW